MGQEIRCDEGRIIYDRNRQHNCQKIKYDLCETCYQFSTKENNEKTKNHGENVIKLKSQNYYLCDNCRVPVEITF